MNNNLNNLFGELISENMSHYIEYKRYPYYFTVGNAAAYCIEDALLFCEGRGLDVGGGKFKFPGEGWVDMF